MLINQAEQLQVRDFRLTVAGGKPCPQCPTFANWYEKISWIFQGSEYLGATVKCSDGQGEAALPERSMTSNFITGHCGSNMEVILSAKTTKISNRKGEAQYEFGLGREFSRIEVLNHVSPSAQRSILCKGGLKCAELMPVFPEVWPAYEVITYPLLRFDPRITESGL